MNNTLDRIRRIRATMNSGGGSGSGQFQRFRKIYMTWREGDNPIRLVGDYIEVRTHYLAPSVHTKTRGLCVADAFDAKIRKVANCFDWDIEKEQVRAVKTCPICRLNAVANAMQKQSKGGGELNDKEKAFFKVLSSLTYPRRAFKWNVIDRLDPLIYVLDGDNEVQVKGLKIATMGMEAFRDITGIFEQCGFDISDDAEGIDIKVIRQKVRGKDTYSATAILEGRNLKVTPLTEEEKKYHVHNLKAICGRQDFGPEDVIASLQPDLREILATDALVSQGPASDEAAAIDSALDDGEEADVSDVSKKKSPVKQSPGQGRSSEMIPF